jgi:hypothetical protein
MSLAFNWLSHPGIVLRAEIDGEAFETVLTDWSGVGGIGEGRIKFNRDEMLRLLQNVPMLAAAVFVVAVRLNGICRVGEDRSKLLPIISLVPLLTPEGTRMVAEGYEPG